MEYLSGVQVLYQDLDINYAQPSINARTDLPVTPPHLPGTVNSPVDWEEV